MKPFINLQGPIGSVSHDAEAGNRRRRLFHEFSFPVCGRIESTTPVPTFTHTFEDGGTGFYPGDQLLLPFIGIHFKGEPHILSIPDAPSGVARRVASGEWISLQGTFHSLYPVPSADCNLAYGIINGTFHPVRRREAYWEEVLDFSSAFKAPEFDPPLIACLMGGLSDHEIREEIVRVPQLTLESLRWVDSAPLYVQKIFLAGLSRIEKEAGINLQGQSLEATVPDLIRLSLSLGIPLPPEFATMSSEDIEQILLSDTIQVNGLHFPPPSRKAKTSNEFLSGFAKDQLGPKATCELETIKESTQETHFVTIGSNPGFSFHSRLSSELPFFRGLPNDGFSPDGPGPRTMTSPGSSARGYIFEGEKEYSPGVRIFPLDSSRRINCSKGGSFGLGEWAARLSQLIDMVDVPFCLHLLTPSTPGIVHERYIRGSQALFERRSRESAFWVVCPDAGSVYTSEIVNLAKSVNLLAFEAHLNGLIFPYHLELSIFEDVSDPQYVSIHPSWKQPDFLVETVPSSLPHLVIEIQDGREVAIIRSSAEFLQRPFPGAGILLNEQFEGGLLGQQVSGRLPRSRFTQLARPSLKSRIPDSRPPLRCVMGAKKDPIFNGEKISYSRLPLLEGIAIDPPGCEDPDDCFIISSSTAESAVVYVGIASPYIQGVEVDYEQAKFAQSETIYFEESKRQSMLGDLEAQACLSTREYRAANITRFSNGEAIRFPPARIRLVEHLTYDEAFELFKSGDPRMEALLNGARGILAHRVGDFLGSAPADYDLNPFHDVIQQFMIGVNCIAASSVSLRVSCSYRQSTAFEYFSEWHLKEFEIPYSKDLNRQVPPLVHSLAKWSRILSSSGSVYTTRDDSHDHIGASYARVSSPVRRLGDLIADVEMNCGSRLADGYARLLGQNLDTGAGLAKARNQSRDFQRLSEFKEPVGFFQVGYSGDICMFYIPKFNTVIEADPVIVSRIAGGALIGEKELLFGGVALAEWFFRNDRWTTTGIYDQWHLSRTGKIEGDSWADTPISVE